MKKDCTGCLWNLGDSCELSPGLEKQKRSCLSRETEETMLTRCKLCSFYQYETMLCTLQNIQTAPADGCRRFRRLKAGA